MSIVTVADILKRAEEFEQMLADYYDRISHETTRAGVRLLTDFMSRHRKRIAGFLAEMNPEQERLVHLTEIRYEPLAVDCHCFEGIELPPDAPASAVLDAAVTFDECLINLYRQALRQSNDPKVIALFEDLIRSEEQDEIELKKIKAMDYF